METTYENQDILPLSIGDWYERTQPIWLILLKVVLFGFGFIDRLNINQAMIKYIWSKSTLV